MLREKYIILLKHVQGGGQVMLRLTLERRKRNLTRAKLGALADIHPSEIGRIESGRLKPYDPWILRLEKVLGVPGDELFEEVDDIDNGQCG